MKEYLPLLDNKIFTKLQMEECLNHCNFNLLQVCSRRLFLFGRRLPFISNIEKDIPQSWNRWTDFGWVAIFWYIWFCLRHFEYWSIFVISISLFKSSILFQIVDLMTLPPLFLSVWLERTWLGLRFFRWWKINKRSSFTGEKTFVEKTISNRCKTSEF